MAEKVFDLEVMSVDVDGKIECDDITGTDVTCTSLSVVDGSLFLSASDTGVSIKAPLIIAGLPTSDPSILDAIWNDAGTLKISAGV